MTRTACVITLVSAVMMTGCVSTEKYQDTLAELEEAKQASAQSGEELEDVKKQAAKDREALEFEQTRLA